MRLLHFSDIHLPVRPGDVPLRSWFGKRLIGGLNVWLNRRRHFADAPAKVARLDALRRREGIDAVLFTGDHTMLGTDAELARARQAVEPFFDVPLGLFQVPGNHDLYTRDVVRRRRFEAVFPESLHSDLPEFAAAPEPWPVARLLGPDVAVVAVNSARPNPPWLSSGAVPAPQLVALERMLADERLRGRFVFVLTHYAPCLADGGPDQAKHGLDNVAALFRACHALRRGALLCGHVHHRFVARPPGLAVPVFCAGSATFAGREGFWMFEQREGTVHATPGSHDGRDYVLESGNTTRC